MGIKMMKSKKSIKRIISFGLSAILLFSSSCRSESQKVICHTPEDIGYIEYIDKGYSFSLHSYSAFLYDLDEKKILYEKNVDRLLYPASTVKLLTAVYALTILDPETIISPGEEVSFISSGSSIAYIKSYHQISVEMLIEGMLLPSGNDAAYALAGAAGRKLAGDENLSGEKAIQVFMKGMNEYAATIGCISSYFSVPDGNDRENCYSSLEDMLLIANLAYENELIRKYGGLFQDNVTYASGHTNQWTNTNKMLDPDSSFYSPYVTGLKTGSLTSYYNLILTASDGSKQFLIGLFGASTTDERFQDGKQILNTLFKENENEYD
jgi:D-alanyl-D-alanine carboxypeptidase (penicillin-binding protein 5/6)